MAKVGQMCTNSDKAGQCLGPLISTTPKLAKSGQTVPVIVRLWKSLADLFQTTPKLANLGQNLHICAVWGLIVCVDAFHIAFS